MELWHHLFIVIIVEFPVHLSDNSASACELLKFHEYGITKLLELDTKAAATHTFPTGLKFYKGLGVNLSEANRNKVQEWEQSRGDID